VRTVGEGVEVVMVAVREAGVEVIMRDETAFSGLGGASL
jgi:hypothetical protein